ncbi:MAG: hypothetical protein MMC33_010571 [Icmadophila ericetorum]|nr:hypothetical protein [Icmadophila ericetorum]
MSAYEVRREPLPHLPPQIFLHASSSEDSEAFPIRSVSGSFRSLLFGAAAVEAIAVASESITVLEYDANVQQIIEKEVARVSSPPHEAQLHIRPRLMWNSPVEEILGAWRKYPSRMYDTGARLISPIASVFTSATPSYGPDAKLLRQISRQMARGERLCCPGSESTASLLRSLETYSISVSQLRTLEQIMKHRRRVTSSAVVFIRELVKSRILNETNSISYDIHFSGACRQNYLTLLKFLPHIESMNAFTDSDSSIYQYPEAMNWLCNAIGCADVEKDMD